MENTQPFQPTQRRAVIDIGTNSVKILVADASAADVCPVFEDSLQTRLGQGFYETHLLQPPAIAKTAEAVAQFAESAQNLGAQTIHVIATSAARDAKNPYDLTSAVERETGLVVEIISGEQEAEWAYQGVTTNPEFASRPMLLLDVGGGSTEFILGHGEKMDFRHSFPLGCVRLLEKFPVSDPPAPAELTRLRHWLADFIKREVREKISRELKIEARFGREHHTVQLVGTGGAATIVARIAARMDDFDRYRIEAVRLTRAQVTAQVEQLWSVPLPQRMQIIGLPRRRADVILSGVAIYEAVMKELGFAELRVSTRGLRFAALKQL